MKRKMIKVIGAICVVIMIFNIYRANTCKSLAMSDVTSKIDIWIADEDVGEDGLNNKIEPILRIIRNGGIIISVISFAIIGLKIMFLSVEEKAIYKQTLVPWATGAILVFAMTTLPSIIYTFIGEENMTGKELKLEDGLYVKSAVYCPEDGNEITMNNCPNYEKCGRTKDEGELGYKCPIDSCRSRVWEFKGNWLCPNCGRYYSKSRGQ